MWQTKCKALRWDERACGRGFVMGKVFECAKLRLCLFWTCLIWVSSRVSDPYSRRSSIFSDLTVESLLANQTENTAKDTGSNMPFKCHDADFFLRTVSSSNLPCHANLHTHHHTSIHRDLRGKEVWRLCSVSSKTWHKQLVTRLFSQLWGLGWYCMVWYR